jgi:hypothetical protein
MVEVLEIKGGAGEFEAALIAVVLDRIGEEEKAVRQGAADRSSSLPAWVRALRPEEPELPLDLVAPRHRPAP